MSEESKYGILLTDDAELHKAWFEELVSLQGVYCTYWAPKEDKDYTLQGEFESSYYEPIRVGCIFQENINQKTAKKLGWISELDEGPTIIQVPYDLPHLEVGALFAVPSAIRGAEDRLFRVVEMSTIMYYPNVVTCKIVPKYESTLEKAEIEDFHDTDFNLLHQR